jgi:uncharacterized delta-60 repeat protein
MRKEQIVGLTAAFLISTSLSVSQAAAEGPGSIDPSFGATTDDGTAAGIVSTSLGNGDDVANGIVTTPDGKIVVAGNHHNGKSNDIIIARYNADGTLDATFGKGDDGTPDGVVDISLGDADDFATSLAVQPDGKIVVGGYHQEGSSTNMVALRVNTDGTLDGDFGKGNDGTPDGVVNISLGDGNDDVRSIAVNSDGKIVLAGNTVAKDGSVNMAVARLNPDGTPDTTFAKDGSDGTPEGFTAVSLGSGDDLVNDMALTSDGKIVLAGTHGPKDNSNMMVAVLDANGELDSSFGTADDGTPNGVVSLSLGEGSDVARGVAVDAKGRIVVVGDSKQGDSTNVIVARLKADGGLDDAFAISDGGTPNGVSQTSLGAGDDHATDVVLDSQGNIIVAGYHQQGDSTNIAVLRFNDDGKLDEAFGTAADNTPNGIVNMSIGAGDDLANGITMQGDKLILVGGTTTDKDGSKNIALMRLLAN